jgi:hypothetical protein
MPIKTKDGQILYLIVEYCNDVVLTLEEFGCDEDLFYTVNCKSKLNSDLIKKHFQ